MYMSGISLKYIQLLDDYLKSVERHAINSNRSVHDIIKSDINRRISVPVQEFYD